MLNNPLRQQADSASTKLHRVFLRNLSLDLGFLSI